MKIIAILLTMFFIFLYFSENYVASTLDNNIIRNKSNIKSVNNKVIQTQSLKYSDGTEVITTITAEEVNPSIDSFLTSNNSPGTCYSVTYYFSCSNIKIHTYVGTSNTNFTQWFYFNLDQTSTGTSLSNVRPSYKAYGNVSVTTSQRKTINNISKSKSTRTIEFKTGIRSSIIGTMDVTTGVKVTGREVKAYGS